MKEQVYMLPAQQNNPPQDERVRGSLVWSCSGAIRPNHSGKHAHIHSHEGMCVHIYAHKHTHQSEAGGEPFLPLPVISKAPGKEVCQPHTIRNSPARHAPQVYIIQFSRVHKM